MLYPSLSSVVLCGWGLVTSYTRRLTSCLVIDLIVVVLNVIGGRSR